MGDNLKQKTIHALKWTTIDRFGQQIIQFLVGLILARWFIKPEQQGLFGPVFVFSAFSYVFIESGFTQALIRKKDIDDLDYNSVFYFNLTIATILYVLLFFSFPFIANNYYHKPELVSIGRISFLTIIITSLYLVQIARLTKELNFKTIAIVNIVSVLIGGTVAIILGVNNFGVWALVGQQVTNALVHFIGYYIAIKWKPKLIFDFNLIRGFGKFSFFLLSTSVLNVLFNNVFIFILRNSVQQIGYYYKANQLSETSNSAFQSIFSGSVYPVFAQIQDDKVRFLRVYREFARKISIITFPLIMTLIVVAKPLIIILLTNVWAQSIPYYQILCLSTLFATLYVLTISALNSVGASKVTFKIEIIKKILIILLLALCFHFGIKAMLLGYAFASMASYFISMFYMKQQLNHYIRHQIIDLIVPFIVGVIIALSCFLLSFIIENYYLLLGTQLIVFVTIFYIVLRKFYSELYLQIKDFVSSKISTFKSDK